MSLAERFASPVSGPSYRLPARLVAVAMTTLVAVYGAGALSKIGEFELAIVAVMVSAAVFMGVNGWYLLRGRTTIDAEGIRQDWVTPKAYPWTQILGARVVRTPFTTRLVMLTQRGPIRAVQGGSPELVRAFEAIVAHYAGTNGSR